MATVKALLVKTYGKKYAGELYSQLKEQLALNEVKATSVNTETLAKACLLKAQNGQNYFFYEEVIKELKESKQFIA